VSGEVQLNVTFIIDTKGNQVNIPGLEILRWVIKRLRALEAVKLIRRWRIACESPEESSFLLIDFGNLFLTTSE